MPEGRLPLPYAFFFISQGRVCSGLEKRTTLAFSAHLVTMAGHIENARSTTLAELSLCQCASRNHSVDEV